MRKEAEVYGYDGGVPRDRVPRDRVPRSGTRKTETQPVEEINHGGSPTKSSIKHHVIVHYCRENYLQKTQ